MNYCRKFFGHLGMILKHKYWVFYFSCKAGIPLRGLLHDLSKFSPTEFFESVKYYTGKTSPINTCKSVNGYSLAWQHHKGRNPHHYEYWLDNFDKGGTPLLIPFKYCIEMTCDWLAAGKAYQGRHFNYDDEYNWWLQKREQVQLSMHPVIIKYFDEVFKYLKNCNGKGMNKSLLKCLYEIALDTNNNV